MGVQIRSGDTLSGLAQRHGTSVSELMRVNPQIKNPNLIYAGAMLNLPGASDSFEPAPAPGPASSNGGGGGSSYTIRPGDTLSGIGARFGVSYQSIAAANGIANPNLIHAGRTLTIPGRSGGGAPAPAPSAPVEGPRPVPGGGQGGVTSGQLRAIMPNLSESRAAQLLPYLNQAKNEGGINTPQRRAAFLAQLAHESVGLTAFEEYASGQAYEGRTDLGNIYPGDGVRYKGRGPIQLTGRSNYRTAGQALGLDLEGNPTRASDIDVGFRIAVWFWNSRGLSAAADRGDFDYITYRINGGYNGKAARDAYYARARDVLGA